MSEAEKTYTVYGTGMNTDDDIRFMKEGDGKSRTNITFHGSGNTGLATTIKGNKKAYKIMQSGTNKVIGSCPDNENKGIVFFVYNSNGNHQIREYFIEDGRTQIIYQNDSDVLDFEEDMVITGVVIDGICYFSDTTPKSINLKAAWIYTNYYSLHIANEYSEIGINGAGLYIYDGEYYYATKSTGYLYQSESVTTDDNTYVVDYLGERIEDYEGELVTL